MDMNFFLSWIFHMNDILYFLSIKANDNDNNSLKKRISQKFFFFQKININWFLFLSRSSLLTYVILSSSIINK